MLVTLITDFSNVLLLPKVANSGQSLSSLFAANSGMSAEALFELNLPLLTAYDSWLKNAQISQVVMYTASKIYDLPAFQPRLQKTIHKIFTPTDFNCKKTNASGYVNLLAELKISAEQTIFLDDSLENIQAAEAVGIKSVHYQSLETAIKTINQIFKD